MTESERECRLAWLLAARAYDAELLNHAFMAYVWYEPPDAPHLWAEFLREWGRPHPIALDGEVIGWTVPD